MNSKVKASDLSLIDSVINEYKDVDGSLITILQKTQGIYGFLPADVLSYIAIKTGIPPAKIFGVATFYTQ
ncbi:MAG: NAD(P)H-dependent oxidoreductase subunit E, partial [Oscillospiraceae bacterium]|nr:NAD(P)H-dependent oxidoreductase subunit E [Oscillospiraceae bacterium]